MAKKILIVDDDQAVLKLLEMNLRSAGYDVLKCMEGMEAVRTVKQELPDLVIMDVMLRGVDGIESADQLKEDKTTKDIPVIFLTGLRSRKEETERGNEIGGHLIFAKPFDGHKLLEKINELIGK